MGEYSLLAPSTGLSTLETDITGTKNLDWLLQLPPGIDTVIMEGSTRSSKTISILQFLILKALNTPDTVVRVFRHDSTTLDKTIIPDFLWLMGHEQFGIWDIGHYNKTEKNYYFPNGSLFSFAGTSDPQKLHGLKQNYAFFNEAMELLEDAYTQVSYRTTEMIILDFNPSFSHHFIFSKLMTQVGEGVAYKHSTYKDNPFLTDKQIRAIECYEPTPENMQKGTADNYKWSVYGLGQRGHFQGAIFAQCWKVIENDEFPDPLNCERFGFGLDFGYSNDPTALTRCALHQGDLYIHEEIYSTDLLVTANVSRPEIESIESRMTDLSISKEKRIYADCASPQAIADLKYSGYNIVPCVKGKDSILAGLDLMKQRRIYVTRSSANIMLELEHYCWKKNIQGEWLRVPKDDFNHAIDSVRYFAMSELKKARILEQKADRGVNKAKSKSGLRSRSRRR